VQLNFKLKRKCWEGRRARLKITKERKTKKHPRVGHRTSASSNPGGSLKFSPHLRACLALLATDNSHNEKSLVLRKVQHIRGKGYSSRNAQCERPLIA